MHQVRRRTQPDFGNRDRPLGTLYLFFFFKHTWALITGHHSCRCLCQSNRFNFKWVHLNSDFKSNCSKQSIQVQSKWFPFKYKIIQIHLLVAQKLSHKQVNYIVKMCFGAYQNAFCASQPWNKFIIRFIVGMVAWRSLITSFFHNSFIWIVQMIWNIWANIILPYNNIQVWGGRFVFHTILISFITIWIINQWKSLDSKYLKNKQKCIKYGIRKVGQRNMAWSD